MQRPAGAAVGIGFVEGFEQGSKVALHLFIQEALKAGAEAFAAIRAALGARYGAGDDKTLLARLADEIRAGALDEGSAPRAALAAALVALTRQKLAESNPGYLESA